MKLYNAPLSPNAMRVRAVAAELGIDLELIDVNLRDTGTKVATLSPVNPNTKVPVLVDGDFVLWESRAINAYLATLWPEAGLYPADPKRRAIIDQWSYWHAIHLSPAMQKVTMERYFKPKFGMGETDVTALEAGLKEMAQFLKVLDGNLAGNEWVAGDLSIADFALATTFVFREPAGISLVDTPEVAGWIARLETRRSWQTAAAPMQALIAS